MADKDIIIVTGACGRIGAQICKRMGDKYRIVGFELLKALYASANEELVPVDLASDESVQQAFTHIRHFYGNRIHSVVHLAAYYSFDYKWSPLYDKITVKGTERLLKALQKFEVEQFIFSSTMLVHAPGDPDKPMDESWPLRGNWGYPASKIATEKMIHEMRGSIPTVIMRIAGIYDDRCHSIPISHQIQRIYEKQLESRVFAGNTHHGASFMHMDDLVDALALAIEKRKTLPPELTVLLGETKTFSYDELQRQISRAISGKEFKTISVPKWFARIGAWVQCHIPFIPKPFIKPWMIALADDNYTLNISRAKQFLGWTPKRSIDATIPKMVEILKKDPAIFYKENALGTPKK